MAKYKHKYEVALKSVRAGIVAAKKKLRAIRPHVSKSDQRRIDLDIRELQKALITIGPICFIRRFSAAKKKKK